MDVAFATIFLGPVVATAIQKAVEVFNNKNKKAEVMESAKSIKDNITRVSQKVEWYQGRRKDTSDDWRDMIAEWRSLLCHIEDYSDKFRLNIEHPSAEQFATQMEEFKTKSKNKSEKIEAHIRKYENSPSAPLQGQPDSPRNHPRLNLFGIEEQQKDLLALVLWKFKKQLQAKAGNLKVTKVISIVGSRGIGKTCLASQVFLHQSLPNSFPLRAFVSATGKHKDAVLEEVLRRLHSHAPGGSVQDARAYLRSANTCCFIVVDDVHDLELGIGVINEFRDVTKVDGIIILTTTVQSFAQQWSRHDGHVYKMMPLSTQLSSTLFSHHCRPADVPESIKEFGVGCDDGVPLAVITWARYCRDDPQTCKTLWSRFGDGNSRDRLERMQRVLKHSYDSLADDSLQACLLYFSLFRPENSVSRGSLVRRWQAEGAEVGCGDNCNNKSMENWKTLVDRNILCPVQVSINEEDQGAKTCRPSGAVHGYITSHKSRTDEGFARVCSDGEWTSPVIRRLSLQTDNAEALKNKGDVSRLRTLQVESPENNNGIKASIKKKKYNGTKAAGQSLYNCGLLRVLDLDAYGGLVSVEEVCNKLKLLKYLSLGSASIDCVPPAIRQLNELQTLDVGKKEEPVAVHVSVLLLPKLKHLVGKFRLETNWEFQRNPKEFKAVNLETLAGFVTHTAKGFPAVMEYMSNLRKVKVFFDSVASTKSLSSRPFSWSKLSYPLADAIKAFLHQPGNHHRSLSLDIQECKHRTSVLRSLESAEGKLYSLKLRTSVLDSFPSFIHKNKLTGIEKLCISFTTLSWQAIIDGHDHLPGLKYLKLVAKGTFPGVLLIKKNQFQNLERICLKSTEILPQIQIEDDALTKLVSLHLITKNFGTPTSMMCNSSYPMKIPQLKNLKEVALRSSSPVDDAIKKEWHGAARGHPKSPQVLFIDNA